MLPVLVKYIVSPRLTGELEVKLTLGKGLTLTVSLVTSLPQALVVVSQTVKVPLEP
jgi:hypothetical protein